MTHGPRPGWRAAAAMLLLLLGGCDGADRETPTPRPRVRMAPDNRPDPALPDWQYLETLDWPASDRDGFGPDIHMQAVTISAPDPHGNRAILRVHPWIPEKPFIPVVTLGATRGLDCPPTGCTVRVRLGERYAHRFAIERQPHTREWELVGAKEKLFDALHKGGPVDLDVSSQGISRGRFRFWPPQGLFWPVYLVTAPPAQAPAPASPPAGRSGVPGESHPPGR